MLTWEVYSAGPPHAVVWTAITYSTFSPAAYRAEVSFHMFLSVRGAQYARTVSARQNTAMEEAAKTTLDQLQAARRRGYY